MARQAPRQKSLEISEQAIERMKRKIESTFERLQDIDIKPTLDNTEKILQTLYDLREVHAELEKAGAINETDPEERPDN